MDFDDDSALHVQSNNESIVHQYTGTGSVFDPVLTVVDGDGLTDSASLENAFELEEQPPIAGFSTITFRDGRELECTDTSTDEFGSIVSWSWNFGDDNTSSVQNPTHTYAADGTYEVTLTVTSDTGLTSDPGTMEVEVPRTSIHILFDESPKPVTMAPAGLNDAKTAMVPYLSSIDEKDRYVGPSIELFMRDIDVLAGGGRDMFILNRPAPKPDGSHLIDVRSPISLEAMALSAKDFQIDYYQADDEKPYGMSEFHGMEKLPSDALLAGPGMDPDNGFATDCAWVVPYETTIYGRKSAQIYVNVYCERANTEVKIGGSKSLTNTSTFDGQVLQFQGMTNNSYYTLSASGPIIGYCIKQAYAASGGFSIAPLMSWGNEYIVHNMNDDSAGLRSVDSFTHYCSIEPGTITWVDGTTAAVGPNASYVQYKDTFWTGKGLTTCDQSFGLWKSECAQGVAGAYDQVAYSISPVSRCGFKYVVPGLSVTSNYGGCSKTSIIPIDATCDVTITTPAGASTVTINKHQEHTFVHDHALTIVETGGSRLSVLTMNRYTGSSADPDYCHVPPQTSDIKKTGFACQFHGLINNYYIYIVCETAVKDEIQVKSANGSTVSVTDWKSCGDYSVGRKSVGAGGYTLESTGEGRFLAYAFGGSLTYESVYYDLGRNWFQKYYYQG
jgi:PKD repeat protein